MTPQVDDRALPLRERKKLRTRRALAEAALRLFSEKGYEPTTLEDLANEVEISKSTFFRFFPAKEAAAIEAEAEMWAAYLATLADSDLSGEVLEALHRNLVAAIATLDPGWDERFLATRRLVAAEPALLGYLDHFRAGIKNELVATLARQLRLDPEDLRLFILAELTIGAFSVGGRRWVRNNGKGGRRALINNLQDAIRAIPASLVLTAPTRTSTTPRST